MTTIVIVDDRITNRRILAKLAGELAPDIRVETFGAPSEALTWLKSDTPDLIITDYQMPGMDGAGFIAALRQLPSCADLPVIVVTAYEDRQYRYSALDAGATDFLLSPVDHDEFRARVRNLLTIQRQRLLLKRRAEQLEANLERSNRLHRVALRESEEKLRLVINSVPAMISATNTDHRFVFMNNFHAWMLGIDPQDAGDRTPEELLGAAAGARWRELDRQVFETGQSVPPYEEPFEDAAGRPRTMLATKAALRDTAGVVRNVVTTAIDISERKQAAVALQEQRNFLRTVIDLDPSYVLALDRSGVITLANQAIAGAFGTTPDKLVGTRYAELAPVPAEAEAFLTDCERVFEESIGRLDVERHFTTVDGKQHWMQIAIVPFDRPGGRTGQILAICSNVTALKDAEAAMSEAKTAAELSNRAKSNFLANMSHELRTPLNAIIGFSEMISGEILGPVSVPKYREYAIDIQTSANRLLSIIGDILDLSRVEAGRITLQETVLEFEAIVHATLDEYRQRAETSDIVIDHAISTDLPLLRADQQRLRQVLNNLLSNALKFTPPGGQVRVEAYVNAQAGIELRISDNGIGMDDAEIPTVLAHFGQVERALIRGHDGAGLGLPLSVAFLKMHGASVEISSRKGNGTTISVVFPPDRSIRRVTQNAG